MNMSEMQQKELAPLLAGVGLVHAKPVAVNSLEVSLLYSSRELPGQQEKGAHNATYPPNWKERAQACLERAGYRCECCGIPHGTMCICKHRYKLYFVHLHAAHIHHDPHNLQAELRALCPDCHMCYDRKTERTDVATRRLGYQVIAVSRLISQAGSAGLFITQNEAGCIWSIRDLSGTASRDQCQTAKVKFFLKQYVVNGKEIPLLELDGRVWNEFPSLDDVEVQA